MQTAKQEISRLLTRYLMIALLKMFNIIFMSFKRSNGASRIRKKDGFIRRKKLRSSCYYINKKQISNSLEVIFSPPVSSQ
ncbi:Uncharacterised protein [uncultured archaeon]|nr:Uncharacterised protein [uncultured archaeon]